MNGQTNAPDALDALMQGKTPEEIITAIRQRSELKNRTAQADIPAPPVQPEDQWRARAAWLLDGQPIHGELKTFYGPAYRALKAGDQAEYSRQRDLLMKALFTIFGPVE